MIDEEHAHFAAVIGIDGAGAVEHGDAVFEGQSAPWANLGLSAFGQFQVEPGGDEDALAGFQDHRPVEVCAEVHAGAVVGGIGGERVVALVGDADFNSGDGRGGHEGKGRYASYVWN